MKRYLLAVLALLLFFGIFQYLYYYTGELYIPVQEEPTYFSKAEGTSLYLDQGAGFEVFDIKGVNLGLGKPGHYATEFAPTKEEYLRWFRQIQDMGANVIRNYILAHPAFYEAFYEYNINNPDPLYLIHGVWVDDYLINSYHGALDRDFYLPFLTDCKKIVDVVHGRFRCNREKKVFSDVYSYDISPWVYGYILGVEWESNLVGFTDRSFDQLPQYQGEYFYTEDASNFEIFLASIGDQVVAYESEKYGQQRVVAFSNWATTDPLDYPHHIESYFKKFANVDVEHIHCTKDFKSGQFASYHIYPYFPDYFSYFIIHGENTYLEYLKALTHHHSMPVVISEFGVPTSRGKACEEEGLGRNQGFLNETEQGEALVSMYQDIQDAGCAGGIVFSWQDEWFKRTWNTMAYVDLDATPYWSDYQTNEQFFGLLSFDPGEKESVCYVDGDKKEWTTKDIISKNNGYRLSMKYDCKFLYFLIEEDGNKIGANPVYLSLDITPKSGTYKSSDPPVSMDAAADFIAVLTKSGESRLLVQEYYDHMQALHKGLVTYKDNFWGDKPQKDSRNFNPIRLLLQRDLYFIQENDRSGNVVSQTPISLYEFKKASTHNWQFVPYSIMDSYETGILRQGNANPDSRTFDSLADFCYGKNFIELRLPWQLLNFADPSTLHIHDDYYQNYGVEYMTIDHISVGVGNGRGIIHLTPYTLEPQGKKPSYHERLKRSYYILQDYWNSNP